MNSKFNPFDISSILTTHTACNKQHVILDLTWPKINTDHDAIMQQHKQYAQTLAEDPNIKDAYHHAFVAYKLRDESAETRTQQYQTFIHLCAKKLNAHIHHVDCPELHDDALDPTKRMINHILYHYQHTPLTDQQQQQYNAALLIIHTTLHLQDIFHATIH